MRGRRGFTLIEILITTAVLVFGLAAIALIFSYTERSNINTQQRTAATLLVYEKLEELKSASADENKWSPGSYVDYPIVARTSYERRWQIRDTTPTSITITVFAARAGLTGRRMELIRAATVVSNTF